jgi:hypothetical protein
MIRHIMAIFLLQHGTMRKELTLTLELLRGKERAMAMVTFELPDELLAALPCAPEQAAAALRLAAAFSGAAAVNSRPAGLLSWPDCRMVSFSKQRDSIRWTCSGTRSKN